ncbi:hypothetical protein BZA70DRAFT_286073 [Myxozyma melibiosi]|uniref:Uncharacterized protein n=1 Tax=Myxozyma melibiosi TaxID=54550 RepID=A0ABR1F004_9ASCO
MSSLDALASIIYKTTFGTISLAPFSTTRQTVVTKIDEALKSRPEGDILPLPYAARNLPPEIFRHFPDDAFPNEHEIVSHLQLLQVFRDTKLYIMKCEGLFETRDSKHDPIPRLTPEDRWAIYIAKAVERYTRWFEGLPSEPFSVRLRFMSGFTEGLKADQLPPIDVLMVWHAHMLHPRAYWDDCWRSSRQAAYFAMPFPWDEINHVIRPASADPNGPLAYDPPLDAHQNFETKTGAAFDIDRDVIPKRLKCHNCLENEIVVPWWQEDGSGWAQDKFSKVCPKCGIKISKEGIAAMQFLEDFKTLSRDGIPMKGTFFDTYGLENSHQYCHSGFANHLLGRKFRPEKLTIGEGEGLDKIRVEISKSAIYGKDLVIEQFNTRPVYREGHEDVLRRMLIRYDDNPTKFAINLKSAIVNQCGFVDNILALSYLSSPFRHETLSRAVERLLKFFVLLRENPDNSLAPPMDVDLVWHTLQLNPKIYFAMSLKITGTLVDHDDSISEKRASSSVSKGASLWKSRFRDDPLGYESCTCVFCEAERELQQSLKLKKAAKLDGKDIDEFYGRACETAWLNGSTDVRRLSPSTAADGRKPADFRHPYVAFTPEGVSKHASQMDYPAAKCVALPFLHVRGAVSGTRRIGTSGGTNMIALESIGFGMS